VWVLPLVVALAALVFAIWVALWSTLDLQGAWLFDTGFVHVDAPVLVDMAGVVATGMAILAGVGELYEALPPQNIEITGVAIAQVTPVRARVAVQFQNGDVLVERLRLRATPLNAKGEELHESVADTKIELMPADESAGAMSFDPLDRREVMAIRVEWATDRGRGVNAREFTPRFTE